jgi:hypothetical protein
LLFFSFRIELLPLVKPVGHDQTALASSPRIPKRGLGRKLLGSGVEGRIGDLFVFRPTRKKSARRPALRYRSSKP